MKAYLCLLLSSLLVKTYAKLADSCFYIPDKPVGKGLGRPFTDMIRLNATSMTSETRVSKIDVCTNEANTMVIGLQLAMEDTKTNQTQKWSAVGHVDTFDHFCRTISIDLASDFLRAIIIGYNDSGIYSL